MAQLTDVISHNKEYSMNNFLDLARARFSVRNYAATPVEEAKIHAILEAARVAPTAKNNQPHKIYVLKSEEAIKKVRGVTQCAYNAPLVFAIGYDKELEWHNNLDNTVTSGETDAAIVCTHMMMEACEQGLGSCWVGWFRPAIPENIVITALLPVGYCAPDAKPSPMHASFRDQADIVTEL